MKNSILVLAIVLGMLFGLYGIALAGRPLATDDAGTVEPGHLQVEAGWEYAKQPSDDKENAIAVALTTGLIWERLDFGIETPYLFLNPDEEDAIDGFGDLETRLKLRFVDETETIPALAVTVGVKSETGDSEKGLGTGEVDFIGNLIATKEFARFTFHGNVGYNYTGDPAEEKDYDLVNLSLAGEYAVNKHFTCVCEICGEIPITGIDEDNPCEILAGATHELPCGTVLDAGVAAGLTDGASDYKITAGLTHEF